MLILTRRAGESLFIGRNIEVTVVASSGSQVRIGIRAPKAISVDREEVRARKLTKGRAAAAPGSRPSGKQQF